jgi:hypothetical protein
MRHIAVFNDLSVGYDLGFMIKGFPRDSGFGVLAYGLGTSI